MPTTTRIAFRCLLSRMAMKSNIVITRAISWLEFTGHPLEMLSPELNTGPQARLTKSATETALIPVTTMTRGYDLATWSQEKIPVRNWSTLATPMMALQTSHASMIGET